MTERCFIRKEEVICRTNKELLPLRKELACMSENNKSRILLMREQQCSYGSIAKELGIPINTVKSCIHRARKEQNGKGRQEISSYRQCKQCGRALKKTEHHKARLFCSDRCRSIWWNANRDLSIRPAAHQQVCKFCGSSFFTYHGKFCSRACFGAFRSREASIIHG